MYWEYFQIMNIGVSIYIGLNSYRVFQYDVFTALSVLYIPIVKTDSKYLNICFCLCIVFCYFCG